MAKITKQEAKRLAVKAGIDFSRGYHQLSNADVDKLLAIRKLNGYRKPVSASGSTGRYFFYYRKRLRKPRILMQGMNQALDKRY